MANVAKKEVNTLPSVFDAPPPAVNEQVFSRVPYILFAHPLNPQWGQLQQAIPDVEESDPVLMGPDGPTPLRPFRFSYWRINQFYATLDGNGGIVKTTFDKKVAEKDSAWKEHLEVGLVVFLPDGKVIPAKGTFKTTKVNCIHAAFKEVEAAKEKDWAAKSANHRAALVVPKPEFRVVTTVKLKHFTNRKPGGKDFDVANGIASPISAGEWGLLVQAFQDEEFMETVDLVNKGLDERISFVKSKVA